MAIRLIDRTVAQVKSSIRYGNAPFHRAVKRLRNMIRYGDGVIHDDLGVLSSVAHLSPARKSLIASARNYRARAEIALDVASNYPGGDYFEFGAGSLNSFRTFLAAFDLNGHAERFPELRFMHSTFSVIRIMAAVRRRTSGIFSSIGATRRNSPHRSVHWNNMVRLRTVASLCRDIFKIRSEATSKT